MTEEPLLYTKNELLTAVENVLKPMIKHHRDMKELSKSNSSKKREHYKMHCLSEALGAIRKELQ